MTNCIAAWGCRGDGPLESRGQMSMLPLLKPRNFYDLAIHRALLVLVQCVDNVVHIVAEEFEE